MQTMERQSVAPVHPKSRRPAPWPVEFYRSAVGKKWVMALTGIMLMGYVFVHMLGNLKLYLGAEDINHYGEWLRDLLVPFFPRTVTLWLLRIGLAAAFVFHIHSAYGLTRINRQARAAGGYVSKRDWQAANAASRSMRYTGVVILLFLIFHLADLTWGTVNPDFVRGDVYRNLVASFERPAVAAIYIVANIALGLHLFHGGWSMFQSLGPQQPALELVAAGLRHRVRRRRHDRQPHLPDRRADRHHQRRRQLRLPGARATCIETCELYVEGEQ